MKKTYRLIGLIICVISLFIIFVAVGCSVNKDNFVVSGKEESVKSNLTISQKEEIKNLVTDDKKLVINYYDAYIWVVYFDEQEIVDYMTYIYPMSSAEEANRLMVERRAQLEKNRSMLISDCKVVDEYIVVDLVDTSFSGISRSHLENNFSELMIY